jgi:cell division protein FtsX
VVARAGIVVTNVVKLLVLDATRNWLRNVRTVTPALGSMSLLLLLAGSSALSTLAVANVLQVESRDASLVHLYLRSTASSADVEALRDRLRSDARVVSVRFVSSQEALQDARRRPGLPSLIDDAGANPFPASLEVRAARLADLASIVAEVDGQKALDPAYPTSYDPGTYRTLQTFIAVAGGLAAVTANAIRAAILARWDDLTVMRLVGASGWVLRGPFVFEGALTGAVSGVLGAGVLLALFAAAQRASAQSFTAFLPGVGWDAALAAGVSLLLAGASLGSAASLVGLRGLRS